MHPVHNQEEIYLQFEKRHEAVECKSGSGVLSHKEILGMTDVPYRNIMKTNA